MVGITRVLHYTSGFAATFGGVESVMSNIVTAMADCEITLLARYVTNTSECYAGLRERGLAMHSLDMPHLTPLNMAEFRRRLRAFFAAHPADVLHFHGSDEPYVVAEARRAGIKHVIVHVHTPAREHRGITRYYDKFKRHYAAQNIRGADRIVAVSENVAAVVERQYRLPPQSVTVLRNGIDTARFAFSADVRERTRAAEQLGGVVLGHIGRFVTVKNQRFAVDVFEEFCRRVPQATLVFVGDGDEREAVEAAVRDKGLAAHVRFLGDRTDIPALLNAMDVFLLPSLFEGFSLVTLEAQSAGLPCVVSDTVPTAAVVTELVCRVPLTDRDGWVTALCDAAAGSRQREAYAAAVERSGYGLSVFRRQLRVLYEIEECV